MVNFQNIRTFLEENSEYFQAKSMSDIRDMISELIYSNDRGIYLLSGDKGIGKSRLIKSIINEIDNDIFIIKDIPEDERTFLEDIYLQLRKKRFSSSVKIEEMRIRVNDAFKKVNHTIIIDNINEELSPLTDEIEIAISKLEDLKIIILLDKTSKSTKEEENSFQFKIKTFINIKPISQTDFKEYLSNLFKNQDVDTLYTQEFLKNSDFIYKVTNGNFLKMIDLIVSVFDIIDTGNSENIDKFKTINKCIIVMSAFDNELINNG